MMLPGSMPGDSQGMQSFLGRVGFRGFGFRVWGVGLRVWGLGFRVWDGAGGLKGQ